MTMFGTLRLWTIIGAVAASVAFVGGIYFKGRTDGRAALQAKLSADRIKIIKDNQEITNEVLNSDDDALCALIGGCGVPDETNSN